LAGWFGEEYASCSAENLDVDLMQWQ
jgi:hypothetical protein